MVQHRHDGREYWTLPGGGVHQNEFPETAAVREVREETGLNVSVQRPLFDTDFNGVSKSSRCFLMSELDTQQSASLGHDPEQAHLPQSERMLQGIAWRSIDDMKDDIQVSKVIEAIKGKANNAMHADSAPPAAPKNR